jgi:alpha-L-fucosidase 2
MGSASRFALLTSCRDPPYKSFSTEWKVDKDSSTDTHRHLSHLIGLYPGYALASYDQATQGGLIVNGSQMTYSKKQLFDAATVSLVHRGNGTGPDANSGWEKMWRAAAWAQLGNAKIFYHELSVRSHIYPHPGEANTDSA